MSGPTDRPMNRRTRALIGSIHVERHASMVGSKKRMVEPWKADGGRPLARLPAPGNDPDVLYRAPSEHPAEMQLSPRARRT